MRIKIEFDSLREEYIDSALALVLDAYEEERRAIPYLPEGKELKDILYPPISRLFSKGTGAVALHNGRLIGFIAAYELQRLWGWCKGVYCPLFGHGAIKEDRSKIYQELYKYAAEKWVEKQLTSHAITLHTHDKETIDTWFWLGFGNRCVDSIRKTSTINSQESEGIIIKKIGMDSLYEIVEVEKALNLYLRKSPMFMHREEEDPLENLTEWLKEENHHLWAAYKEGKVVGHMQIQPDGESFITLHPTVMNITGAYVLDSERGSGIASLLLDTIQKWQLDNGYSLCGVDFESFNLDGSKFWNRYFTPYTFSLARRIE
ncbi:GNAT family N-acetyltransferase [Alkaliphilus serpentinus]|uniref:GNAT family N-acetyltransferase n=1 Tax=Alkaliphilus serpentinus TaxID=1482731 RepID=A0A833HR98_9FIRM|nr:GNAT family N-acetyltransferase [Alkaliphilus serpentinus]KAB3532838.1 GNAT family N-acetyltransferase [Alkaliphilus serpentinus]